MKIRDAFVPVVLFVAGAGCGTVPSETEAPPAGRELVPAGILQGNVVYSGPHPCSRNGHIVGAAILFVFDRRNPPPPNGTASTPVNFGVVAGDALFPEEPRNAGATTYCPADQGVTDRITLSAPFSIETVPAGSYMLSAFYDYTGDFLPTFKIRASPEMGDIGGGAIDTVDALKPINANPNYQPVPVPIDVGIAQPLLDGSVSTIPDYVLPDTGFVAKNITVTIGSEIETTRPYFYPAGLSVAFDSSTGALSSTEVQSSVAPPTKVDGVRSTAETDPNYVPVLTIPQDIAVLAPANNSQDEPSVNHFESTFPHLVLHWSVPEAEHPAAVGTPFDLQLPPQGTGGFPVWQNATFDANKQVWVPQDIAAAKGVPLLWPSVALTKLVDDPDHTLDPASLQAQGSATAPLVVLQAITLLEGDGVNAEAGDSLFKTGTAEAFGSLFPSGNGVPAVFTQDRLTVVIQPAAICFGSLYDPGNPDKRGTLVTPHLQAQTADLSQPSTAYIVAPNALEIPGGISSQVNAIKEACLPIGRYSVNVVYPNGQSWTTPNEAGGCTAAEGPTDYAHLDCTGQPRPILYSQGTRAVVEVVKATDPSHCTGAAQVPAVCLPTPLPAQ